MLALRQAAVTSIRRSARLSPPAARSFSSSPLEAATSCRPYHDAPVAPSSSSSSSSSHYGYFQQQHPATLNETTSTTASSTSSLLSAPAVTPPISISSIVLAGMEWLDHAVWHMSSTLKKRKAKMNKHKLRKRRKKNRKKTKKV